MSGLYLVHLADSGPKTVRAVRKQSVGSICVACAAGYHEQLLLPQECCDCPCHGTQMQCADNKVAA